MYVTAVTVKVGLHPRSLMSVPSSKRSALASRRFFTTTVIGTLTRGMTICDAEAVIDGVVEGVPPGRERVVDAVGEFEGDGRLEADSEGYFELEGVSEGTAPIEMDAVGVRVDDRVPLLVPVFDDEGVCEADCVAVCDPDAPAEREPDGEEVGVPEFVPVDVNVGVPVIVTDDVREFVGDTDSEAPYDKLLVVVRVIVLVGVRDVVVVVDGVVDGVPEGVSVPEPVDDDVCVRDAVIDIVMLDEKDIDEEIDIVELGVSLGRTEGGGV